MVSPDPTSRIRPLSLSDMTSLSASSGNHCSMLRKCPIQRQNCADTLDVSSLIQLMTSSGLPWTHLVVTLDLLVDEEPELYQFCRRCNWNRLFCASISVAVASSPHSPIPWHQGWAIFICNLSQGTCVHAKRGWAPNVCTILQLPSSGDWSSSL